MNDKVTLRNLIGGLHVPVDDVAGDNLAIALASYFSEHPNDPAPTVLDEYDTWSVWTIENVNSTLDRVVQTVLDNSRKSTQSERKNLASVGEGARGQTNPIDLIINRNSDATNLCHMKHVFVGYRDWMLHRMEVAPYAPSSPKCHSWNVGKDIARADLSINQ